MQPAPTALRAIAAARTITPARSDWRFPEFRTVGKDYDPTAAAREEKERRELRHRAAMEKKQAKEFAECTFKPTVSRKSVEMLQTTHKERPSLHTPGRGNSRTTYQGQQTLVR